MKHKPLLISIILYLMIAGCEKQDYTANTPLQQSFVKDAMRYLESQVPNELRTTLRTNSPDLINYQGTPMAVRVYPADRSTNRFVLLYKKAGHFTGQWIDPSDLILAAPGSSAGTVSLLDLKGRLQLRYTIEENKVTEIYDAPKGSNTVLNDPSLSTPDNPQALDAFVVTSERNNKNYFSVFWLLKFEEDFQQAYLPMEENEYNGGRISEMEVAVAFPGPDHPIKDIREELKCFTIESKATYFVTVNVNQPEPNTNSLINFANNYNAGHAYLTLQENLSNGDIIIRNIGFYPMHSAKPGSENDQSIFGDDTETVYSVSMKIPMSHNEFGNLLANIKNDQSREYNLESYNCTTVIISAFNSINVHLPATTRESFKFDGYNPADLGQDIRKLSLDKFSVENGSKQIVRTVSKKNDQLPPKRTGSCR